MGIVKFSAKSIYGIKALVYMALKDHSLMVTVKELSKTLDIPEKYLEQIFTSLKKSGILSGKRGAAGGYTFARPIEDIRIGDILRIFEGDLLLSDCLSQLSQGLNCTRRKTCNTREFWERLSGVLKNRVDGMSLGTLKDEFYDK